jgi:arsenite-transporting ATPase
MEKLKIEDISLTKYLFFTGKGGVGKTSISCAIAVALADNGKNVLLVSTDPASNLQDVFETKIDKKGVVIKGIPNLTVINVDPIQAAEEYKESVVGPYRGIIFDTAPTGHTLRMLELPSAWTNFINENTTGASCLGQLSGLGDKRQMYAEAVATLSDGSKTTLVLVSRPRISPIIEASRTSKELLELGINNQLLIINGILDSSNDDLSLKIKKLQDDVLENMPSNLSLINTYLVPMKSFNITGIDKLRNFFGEESVTNNVEEVPVVEAKSLDDLIDDLYNSNKKVVFTMGKGGVGKTTIAYEIAKGLVERGLEVHLTTTDPANHLGFVAEEMDGLTISSIDEKKELKKYQDEVLTKARKTMSENDVAYIEEDLRSPCTQEIAVFRAFANVVEKADNEVVVIDTAPTGHTLLLLNSTQSYSKEIDRSSGEVPESVTKLLPRLRNEKETEVVIVTLAEATPVFEAERLHADLKRAKIPSKWWIINQSLLKTNTKHPILLEKAKSEKKWINEVKRISNDNFAIIPWHI